MVKLSKATWFYPETQFVVCTANPELLPQLAVYEIEHGIFNTLEDATEAALPLLKKGSDVQIIKREWIESRRDVVWYNADHWSEA